MPSWPTTVCRGKGAWPGGGRQPSSVAVTTSVSRMNSLPVRLAKYAAAVGSPSHSFSFFYLPLPLPLATFISYDNSGSSKSLAWNLKYLCGQTGDVNACWLRLVRCLFPTSFPLSLSLSPRTFGRQQFFVKSFDCQCKTCYWQQQRYPKGTQSHPKQSERQRNSINKKCSKYLACKYLLLNICKCNIFVFASFTKYFPKHSIRN